MLFVYNALDEKGSEQSGSIEAVNVDIAISALQRRGLIISNIKEADTQGGIFERSITIFDRIKNKDIVILSRQIATLFQAQVSALRVFRLLASEIENQALAKVLNEVSEDLQSGSAISKALARHPKAFSEFYVNMVRSGEESGKLDQTFAYLADYLDRTYEVTSKAKNAMIYPAFVIFTFFAVMILMLTMVIPKISQIILDSGQEVPVYTKAVIALSNFFVDYGVFLMIGLIVGVFFLIRFVRTGTGHESFDSFKITLPYLGNLYRKLYLSRVADNLSTMLSSGIPMLRALETTAAVVDNAIFKKALADTTEAVKGGSSLSDAFERHKEIPNIMTQMIKVGEESGNLGEILGTLSKFYQREVTNAVDTLVGLIEPLMIVALGLGVGVLLAAVLIPIYNVAGTF
jgi:type IV pilus assembly protein PilC